MSVSFGGSMFTVRGLRGSCLVYLFVLTWRDQVFKAERGFVV